MRYTVLPAVLCAGLLSACVAPQSRIAQGSAAEIAREAQAQREVAAQTQIDRQQRLERIAYPIWKANSDLCGNDVRPATGALIANLASHDKGELGSTYRRLLKLEARPRVTHVIPGSAADGNLLAGDILLAIDDIRIGSGAAALDNIQRAVAKALPGFPIRIDLLRDGMAMTKALIPDRSCAYPVRYLQDSALNAYADGNAVYVTAGMMRFAESDQELAVVLGHELAHNAEHHVDAKQANVGIGLIFDILAAGAGIDTGGVFSEVGAKSYSQDFESEADYIGLYYLARAGVPIEQAAHFWRRMAAENPDSIRGSYQSTHPSTAQRFTQLDKAATEIRHKQRTGRALLPNRIHPDTPTATSMTETSRRARDSVRQDAALWRR